MNADLQHVAELMRRHTGILTKPAQLPSLEAALRRVDPTMTATDFLVAETADGAPLLERMIDEVTIKETFFFRQRPDLDAIDWPLLVAQARASGSAHARVWVPATASGEEAYTLAILATEAFAPDPPPVLIHATDISTGVLARARGGRYGGRSAHLLDRALTSRYFTQEGPDVVVGEQLRRIVRFSRQNLTGDFTPASGGPFDLIACRNVLIYFDPEVVEQVVAGLTQALARDGTLLLGAADRLCCSAGELLRLEHGPVRQPPPTRGSPALPDPAGWRRPLARDARDTPALPAATSAPVMSSELNEALRAADAGDLHTALEATTRALVNDPLDSNAYFIRGLAERRLGRQAEAIAAFRGALYIEPGFALAAFELGRAHEACGGDGGAAVRAYDRALRALDHTTTDVPGYRQVDLAALAAVCTTRLRALVQPLASRRSGATARGVS